MKIAHWTMYNNSGMNRVAETLCNEERKLGMDSYLCNPQNDTNPSAFDHVLDADIHVSHTHFPSWFQRKIEKKYKLVWVGHGTPDHIFQTSVESAEHTQYGCSDGWMLTQHWLKVADAAVTFWPRHQAIYQSMVPKSQKVHLVPLGVDTNFWKKQPSKGKYAGDPSVFSCENSHYIKWPYDLLVAWPWVYPKVKGNPSLGLIYLPSNLHRHFFPLVNANGAGYASHISNAVFSQADLVNSFNSIDYYVGLVRYGDFNRCSLEANACGATTISYRGNPYSDYWLTEGDQRVMAEELTAILNKQVEPRKKDPVLDSSVTAEGMKVIYESIL